jgi:hypothetical protein
MKWLSGSTAMIEEFCAMDSSSTATLPAEMTRSNEANNWEFSWSSAGFELGKRRQLDNYRGLTRVGCLNSSTLR